MTYYNMLSIVQIKNAFLIIIITGITSNRYMFSPRQKLRPN